MSESVRELLSSDPFRRELAQISAHATLSELDIESETRWRYRAERAVRNLIAIGQAVNETLSAEGLGGDWAPAAALTAARSWEDLAGLGEHVTRRTALLNAALNYEAAGYQANAACLARLTADPTSWTSEPNFEGVVSAFLQRLFLRVTTLEETLTRPPRIEQLHDQSELIRRSSQSVASKALIDASSFFLTGRDTYIDSAQAGLELALTGFSECGDMVAFNTIRGLQTVIPLMHGRSTWENLSHISDHPRWARYIRVLARGLGDDLLETRSISELWPSQLAAVEGGLLDSRSSTAIRMPTSAGKTRVAELAIVHTLVTRPGSKCIYIAPYRALASEIQGSFNNLFYDLGYGASTVPGGYDDDEMSTAIAATDEILILTPEKLDLLFRLQSDLFERVSLVVIDEGHLVSDRSRGPKFELLVSRLRRRIPDARFLMMSAVVSDETLQDFAEWLGGDEGRTVSTDWRPALLKYGRLDWDGARGTLRFAADDIADGGLPFIPNLITRTEYSHISPETGYRRRPKYPSNDNKGEVAAELAYRFAPLGPVLIFSMQTNWTESIAAALERRIQLAELTGEQIPGVFTLRDAGRAVSVSAEWLGRHHILTRLLRRGIAFHHGRLPEAVRRSIEDDFRARRISVLVATSTLAQGVNLPVRTVVVHSCRSRDDDGKTRKLSAREYWNIAGRAGRAGSETEGTVIHIAMRPYDVQDFNDYAERRANVERVDSALHRMLRDLVQDRMSSEEAAAQLDADLLALLVEEDEALITDDDTLAETLSSSLFRIQAAETEIPIESLIHVMTSTARRIVADVPDLERRRVFAGTGLSTSSCQHIAIHVERNAEPLVSLLASADIGIVEDLLDVLLAGLAEVREMEPRASLSADSRELLTHWISGRAVSEIAEQTPDDEAQDVTEFIEDAFSYRMPWGASAYLRIASAIVPDLALGTLAANLPGMIKYGVPSPEASWAMTAGVASRGAGIVVAQEFVRTNDERSVGQFRCWLGTLEPNSLAERLRLSGPELESTARAVLHSQPNDYLSALDERGSILPLRAKCWPTRNTVDTGFVYELDPGFVLDLARDRDSTIDRNAVVLSLGRQRVAYVQADAARALGPELDAGLKAVATVLGVSDIDGPGPTIQVEISSQD